MADPYFLLWLEGPLQSWGFDSKFGRRDTLNFPTKSGLMGMVCCALGKGGPQKELLAEFADLDLQVTAYVRKDRKGCPCPREPLLRDFHMVGSGYDTRDPWQNLLVPKKSDGTKAVGGGTKITYRYYLQDMAFAACLQVPEQYSGELKFYLQNPVWELCLGRKSCAPTDFIFQGEFKTVEKAFITASKIAEEKNRVPDFKVFQGEQEGDDTFTLNDVPLQFGPGKKYRDRMVTISRMEN